MKARRRILSVCLVWPLMAWLVVAGTAQAQGQEEATGQLPSDLVTLNVDEGQITQVLNAFSRQTGRSIVLGPEVQGKVTARLSNVQWRDALDAILKPYGYGYYMVGDTIIVGAAEKVGKSAGGTATNALAATSALPDPVSEAPAPEPLIVKVFTLKYLDAADVEDLVRGQLTPGRGSVSRLIIRGQSWKSETTWGGGARGGGGGSATAESLGRLQRRAEEKDIVKGKTLVVIDTGSAIQRVEAVLGELDRMPIQVQIEAKFIEVRAGLLRDIGVEFGTGSDGATAAGVQTIGMAGAGKLYAAGAQQISGTFKPAAFDAESGAALNSSRPFNAGLSLAFQKLTEAQFQVLIHLLQEDGSYNVLSSPRILTMNNQDATIIVGTKYPIINSQTTAGGAGTATTSTSLEYYENIGVQLKVLPQVCDGQFINLVVHPSVRDQVATTSGKVGTGAEGGTVSLTEYPVLATREAETQILMKSGQTVVIGGLLRDKQHVTKIKVPVLGSIPLLGVLFRRETVDTEKTELLIFITASIRNPAEEAGVKAPATAAEGIPGGAAAAP